MWAYVWMGVVGLVAALIAKFLLPGRNGPDNLLGTALIGVAGSYVGSFLGQLFGFYQSGEYAGLGGSIVGAVILLLLWGLVFKNKPAAKPAPPQKPAP